MANDPASSESGKNNEYLQRAYALPNVGAARDLYDEWATSYDKDLTKEDYASPQRAIEAAIDNLSSDDQRKLRILDAGCGTGLVGNCLAQSSLASRFQLDGLDLSESMLNVARKTCHYSTLETADLNKRIRFDDSTYDLVICVGTLTKGHVGPKVLVEFARVTTNGGLIVATVHDEIWDSHGYKREVDRLNDNGTTKTVSTDEFGIVKGSSKGGRMVVLRKL